MTQEHWRARSTAEEDDADEKARELAILTKNLDEMKQKYESEQNYAATLLNSYNVMRDREAKSEREIEILRTSLNSHKGKLQASQEDFKSLQDDLSTKLAAFRKEAKVLKDQLFAGLGSGANAVEDIVSSTTDLEAEPEEMRDLINGHDENPLRPPLGIEGSSVFESQIARLEKENATLRERLTTSEDHVKELQASIDEPLDGFKARMEKSEQRMSNLRDSIDCPGGWISQVQQYRKQATDLQDRISGIDGYDTELRALRTSISGPDGYEKKIEELEGSISGPGGYRESIERLQNSIYGENGLDTVFQRMGDMCATARKSIAAKKRRREQIPLDAMFDDEETEEAVLSARDGTVSQEIYVPELQSHEEMIEMSFEESDGDMDVTGDPPTRSRTSTKQDSIATRNRMFRPSAVSRRANSQNAKRRREAVPTRLVTQSSNLNKKKKKVQPGSSIADPIGWMFLVPGTEGHEMKELEDLPQDTREAIEQSFEYRYSSSNDVNYPQKDRSRHDAYAGMVRESNLRAHIGRGCVNYFVWSKQGRPHQWTLSEDDQTMACDSCTKKGAPCADIKEHNGEMKLCFHPRYDAIKDGVDWTEAKFWIYDSE
jgi:predicted  nucleic acid-binding Zn-ribbon protein